MTELKYGGNNVGKIMYNGQEFGGATKLEPGTILYMSESKKSNIESVHLLSTTKNWNNINGFNVGIYIDKFSDKFADTDISSDDFKNSDLRKSIKFGELSMDISTSIVDGEYRLNIKTNYDHIFVIKAL